MLYHQIPQFLHQLLHFLMVEIFFNHELLQVAPSNGIHNNNAHGFCMTNPSVRGFIGQSTSGNFHLAILRTKANLKD